MADACFACLGRPLLLDSNSEPVAVKTRKALAILGYVSRMADKSAPREVLADLLWSNAERPKAMQSLRQGLRQLKTAEELAGFDVVRPTSSHVQLDAHSFHSDLTQVLALLQSGEAENFKAAEDLWRGDYLAGFEDIDPEFANWLLVERERVRSEVTSAALRHLEHIGVSDGGERAEAGGRFLLKIDPAMEAGHAVLIRLYRLLGQQARAEEQFKACEREMQLHLDAMPSEETRALLSQEHSVGIAERHVAVGQSTSPLMQAGLLDTHEAIKLPEISIVSEALVEPDLADARHLKEEVVAGLSAYRSFELYQAEYHGEENAPAPTLVEGNDLGSYLLRFRHDQRSGKISIQFEDRTDGRIVFNEIVDLSQWESIRSAASHATTRIHLHSTGRLRNPNNSAAFARWCQADALIWNFDPQSDRKALKLLEELERTNGQFSMLYSSRAMINMRQMIMYPVQDRVQELALDDVLSLCEQAVMLDPWQPLNQRAHGWALMQSNMTDLAKRAFLQAGRLNSVDPANLMSVSEGLALAGDVELARQKADLAMSLFASVPRVIFEYYSNVFFAAEDYETSLQFIEKASLSNISGLITRVASLLCAGRQEEAMQVLNRYSDRYNNIIQNTGLGQRDPDEWSSKINLFQDSKTRHNYGRGVDLVKRYFFGDRAAL